MIEFRRRCAADGSGPLGNVPGWMSDLLRAREIDTKEKAERFLHPSLDQLYDPFLMPGMRRAVELIRDAIGRGNRILVYGDYDVDGISACTVLLETLREAGADADYRVPHRHTEGYGLNISAVEEAAKAYQLLITVDCGISNKDEVREAKARSMQVIVTDHHEIPEELPEADVILNPLLKPERKPDQAEGETEPYPFPWLCGAGVALKICQALKQTLDQDPETAGKINLESKLEIAALATVADIVPLKDENRVIVREGLKRMAHTARPGLRALMECAAVSAPVRSEDLAFRLGPRLNAAGRLEHASLGVQLLMTRDEAEGKELAERLDRLNRQRQEEEKNILKKAREIFDAQVDLTKDRVIILQGEDWNPGLIGLAAGKICERFHHPTIVLTGKEEEKGAEGAGGTAGNEEQAAAVGSCRSIPGINIYEMLGKCSELFIRYGGHAQAAGLTIPLKNIAEFRKKLNEVIQNNCDVHCFVPVKEYDTELSLADVTLDTIDRLQALEPTGYGNPAPVFLVRNAFVQQAQRVGKDQSHLRLSLLQGGTERGGIGFGLGAEADRGLERVDALFCPSRNEYNGTVTPQLQLQAVRPASDREEKAGETQKENERNLFLDVLQEMSRLASKKGEYGGDSFQLRPEHLPKEKNGLPDVSDDKLREIYLGIRDRVRAQSVDLASAVILANALGISEYQLWTALTALQEIHLLAFQEQPFRVEMKPVFKISPSESPLVRYLRGLAPSEKKEPTA